MFSDSFTAARLPSKIEIGQVLGGAFGVVGRRWPWFVILTVLLQVLPQAATNIYILGANHPNPATAAGVFPYFGWTLEVFTPVSLVFTPVYLAFTSWMVWADANKSWAGGISALRAVAPRIGWILLANLAVYVARWTGFVLLVIPGLIVVLALYVAIPACAVEGLTATGAIRRSLELTRNQRWRLLGLLVVVSLIAEGLSIIIGLASMMAGFTIPGAPGMLGVGLRAMVTSLASAIGAAVVGSAYVELRQVKSGVGANDVAAVFA